jgi:hypothetical protein
MQRNLRRWPRWLSNPFTEQFDSGRSHSGHRHPDGREQGVRHLGDARVVKSDHAQLLRHFHIAGNRAGDDAGAISSFAANILCFGLATRSLSRAPAGKPIHTCLPFYIYSWPGVGLRDVSDCFDESAETCFDLLIDVRKFGFDGSGIVGDSLHQLAHRVFLLLEKCAVRLTRGEQQLAEKLEHHLFVDGLFRGLVDGLNGKAIEFDRLAGNVALRGGR